MRVNSVAQEPMKKGASFRIVGKKGEYADSDLQFAEVSNFVKTALSAKGLYEAPRPDLAQVVVEIDFGMESPRAAGGPRSNGTSGPSTTGSRPVSGAGLEEIGMRPRMRGGLEKHLVLIAHEAIPSEEDQPPKTLWSVQVTTSDMSDDLRRYLPLLAAVGMENMGTDSGGARTVVVSENEKSVAFVKKGL